MDACELNNLLNVMQVVILVALLRWVRGHNGDGLGRDRKPPE